ncbi:MAG: hypothetical protein JCHSAcid_05980 [uncultured Acidilobus sp. JCHS]|jgi:Conserved TM helix.|nr:MAG: hypothetical protein JCHSAcid_05980 [uncultured Acidilobus sp. JCHS]
MAWYSPLIHALTQSLPSIVEFIVIVIIGIMVAYGVAAVLRRALLLKYFDQYPEVKGLLGLSVGAVKAFIILVTLAIAFAVLKLGPATVYMQEVANYPLSLAGAIILLTLGVALINILVDYIQRQVGGASSPFMASVFNILKLASTP